ncbi:nitric oxide reductase transcriptional regulator NorR [Pelistega sp. NLN82]|uniref:Nitric oxide reductase transcriptional regulator NorR n=1 Tax=Pelistega ratti TaxID=2652177 RepID=A0A6L9Y4B6_9BURK|nr:nitric oxide reductase transcriptional regulator NorR [Pelistega ratti]NEN75231.1 nitric oxide reductase transcriptional regulator NorR [Pelistega ratti]
MSHHLIIEDLNKELSPTQRLARLATTIKTEFGCSAVGLLRLHHDTLLMEAAAGLSPDTLGRQFKLAEHPRLQTIVNDSAPVHFDQNSSLPDPYDGLVDESLGENLHVHDCLGCKLFVNGQLWGIITLDAMKDTFTKANKEKLFQSIHLFEASIRMAQIEKQLAEQQLFTPIDAQSEIKNNRKVIGDSPAILHLTEEIRLISDSDLPLLITGETGVGKDVFAHYAHAYSKRHARPLIIVNCAALPDALAESELFGHVKGAFSGATHERIGRFEAADNGTLFLDEIGELSLSIQSKLLRAIQNGEIQRLGSDKLHYVNVRIIAASNRDLKKEVEEGNFRKDLYHRLSVYPLHIPPLRERGNDILLLAGYFLELNRSRLGLRGLRLSPSASQALLHYHWPGNVRELEHIISRASLKARGASHSRHDIVTIESYQLDIDNLSEQAHPIQDTHTAPAIPVDTSLPLKVLIQNFEKEVIQQTLEQTHYRWTEAGKRLGIDTSNLHKLAKKLGLK